MTGFARRSIRLGAKTLARLPLSPLLRRLPGSGGNVLHVLTYHRVDWPEARPDLLPATLSATPASFAEQMRRIRNEFCPVDLAQVHEAMLRRKMLPQRALLITFDDAYRDFRQHAWPVLRELHIPVVIFVPTGFADDPGRAFWWDRLHWSITQAPAGARVETAAGAILLTTAQQRKRLVAKWIRKLSALPHADAMREFNRIVEALPGCSTGEAVMDWDDLRSLAKEGVELAPHSRSHPLMNRIPSELARAEIAGSRADLLREIGRCPAAFAYPGGAHNDSTRAILAEAGFALAFSTHRGVNQLANCDALRLRRINVGVQTTPEMLSLQLSLPTRLFNACCDFGR